MENVHIGLEVVMVRDDGGGDDVQFRIRPCNMDFETTMLRNKVNENARSRR